MENRDDVKNALHALIFAVMFLLLFVILTPVLVKWMDSVGGKTLYGVLTAGAVGVALRLRSIARKL